MDGAYLLAQNVMNTRYSNIPAETVTATKKQILDTIGTALGGSKALGIKPLVELIKDWDGKEESTIIGYGGKVPAVHAAQANASMAHALDYDDTHEPGRMHCSVTVVPTALAVAERQGNKNGKELITSVALGVDLSCRMAMAIELSHPEHFEGGWHFTPLLGYFSTAATAGRLLGLDEDKMVNALGIAYHQTAGNVQCVLDGAMTKRMGPGFAAQGGIMAALMAEKGITGAKNSLEGEWGFYKLYHAGCNKEVLTDGLGQRFEGATASLKPYPCCRLLHQFISMTLDLVRDKDIKPDEIEQITVSVPGSIRDVCFPLEMKSSPRNIVDCQFSLPWTVACAAVRGRVGLGDFNEESVRDKAVREVAQKVVPVVDESLPDPHSPGKVVIKTKKSKFQKRGGPTLGSPENPLSMDAIVNKFRECAAHAVRPLPAKSADKLIDTIMNLEEVDD